MFYAFAIKIADILSIKIEKEDKIFKIFWLQCYDSYINKPIRFVHQFTLLTY
jgi:hypothetical protein